jgi:hypothetical protein
VVGAAQLASLAGARLNDSFSHRNGDCWGPANSGPLIGALISVIVAWSAPALA